MAPIVPLVAAAIGLIIAIASGKKKEEAPAQLPAHDDSAAPPGTATHDTGAVPDAFQKQAETALATGDTKGAEALAQQAQDKGLLSVARNIREEIAKADDTTPKHTPSGADKPVATPAKKRETLRLGSKGDDVIEWQHVIGQKADGAFGPATDAATRVWQKAHGLTADGIVGPNTWAVAYGKTPALGKAPAKPALVSPAVKAIVASPTWVDWYNGASGPDQNAFDRIAQLIDAGNPASRAEEGYRYNTGLYAALVNYRSTGGRKALKPAMASTPFRGSRGGPASAYGVPGTPGAPRNLAKGMKGDDVKAWQAVVGVKQDGDFGPATDTATRLFQKTHGLKVDGIVGPATRAAIGTPVVAMVAQGAPATAAPAPAATPATGQSDARTAAQELTGYLVGLGGLAGRGKESKPKVATLLSRIGTPDPRGYYGRMTARRIMELGLVPVAPYYWNATTATKDKAEFLKLVDDYAAADKPRAAQWAKLRADSVRS